MRIAITGATGNVGTALIRALLADGDHEIVGIARRLPEWAPDERVHWFRADITRDDLGPAFAGADAVVHLAWLIQPSRDRRITDHVNMHGTERVFAAAVAADVPTLVHASSVAAYRPPPDPSTPVDEDWPTDGISSSYYSEQKVFAERCLDEIESAHPELRTVRLRPGLIFQRANASQIRRFFGGPFIPGSLLRAALIPLIPNVAGLAGQVVHADDVADLYRRAVTDPSARGAYNVAAQPPLDAQALAQMLHARPLPLPAHLARGVVDLTWRARLQPVSPGWLDLARGAPIMRTDRARTELGWEAARGAGAVIAELLEGLRAGAGFPTPPLDPHAGGRLRLRELRTGVGGPNPEDRRSAAA